MATREHSLVILLIYYVHHINFTGVTVILVIKFIFESMYNQSWLLLLIIIIITIIMIRIITIHFIIIKNYLITFYKQCSSCIYTRGFTRVVCKRWERMCPSI